MKLQARLTSEQRLAARRAVDDADRQERLAARRAVKDRQQQLVVDGIIREADQKMAACESALEAVGTAEAPVRAGAGDAAALRAADVREIESAQRFSKACPQERFATVLYKSGHKCTIDAVRPREESTVATWTPSSSKSHERNSSNGATVQVRQPSTRT